MKISISKNDLKRETFRGTGPGGQHKNVTETCVRLTHIPTGVKAEGRTERSQYQNEQACLALLISKLHRHYQEIADREAERTYDDKSEASFGHQIRTYRLCGNHQVVIDHRTGVEDSPHRVLNGKIDKFLCPTSQIQN
jgi:peptide chain release factor 2